MISWTSIAESLPAFLTSPIFNTVIASAFGALFGAWGAQIAISRNQKRHDFSAEVNNVNAALALCVSVSNSFLALKKQHAIPMKKRYDDVSTNYELFKSRNPYTTKPIFEYQVDFESFPKVRVPIHILEEYLFDKISLRGRGIAAVTQLFQCIDSLNSMIDIRNSLIDEFRGSKDTNPKDTLNFYLGLPTENGIDNRFKDAVNGILTYVDDCIFFSNIVEKDLVSYGNNIIKTRSWGAYSKRMKLHSANWSGPEVEELLPKEEDYSLWLKGFKTAEKQPRSRIGFLKKKPSSR